MNDEQAKQIVEELLKVFEARNAALQDAIGSVDLMVTEARSPGGVLENLVHSVKMRVKHVDSLRGKIWKKIEKARKDGAEFDITAENLFDKITDIAGYRIMHLHPKEMDVINKAIIHMLDDRSYKLVEEPEARVWDLESEAYFKGIGIKTKHTQEKLYSSVHYVVRTNRKAPVTCEIQVRTLADELWGAVDHKLNYKRKLTSVACVEQIKSLAHLTTSCNRLVTSIFASHEEWRELKKAE
jgi:putative GTP pyrophosphokinase